jgi:DNA-binding IclR family transcriptional regulator
MREPVIARRPTVLDTSFDILEYVCNAAEDVALADIVKHLGIPKTTAFRIVSMLVERGYLDRIDGKYRGSLKIAALANSVLSRVSLRQTAFEPMSKLARETGETVHLSVRNGLRAVCIERVEGTNSVRLFMQVGRSVDLTKGSSAKILLAHADQETVNHIVIGISSADARRALIDQIAEIREKGYVVTHGELDEYAIGIAAPVTDVNHNVVAAVSLAGLEVRLGGERLDESISMVRACAKEISRALGDMRP